MCQLSDSNHHFGFSDFGWPSAVGPAASIRSSLATATSSGGPGVHQLFAGDLSALLALRRAAVGDGSNWLVGTDNRTGLATRYVGVGDSYLTVGIYPRDDAAPTLSAGSSVTAQVGFLYLTMLTGAGSAPGRVSQLMSAALTYQGDPLEHFVAADGLENLIDTLVDKAVGFVSDMFELALPAGSAADLGSAAQAAATAADEAATAASGRAVITAPGGVQIETDVVMSTGEAIGLGLQVVAVLALLSLKLLAKQMTSYVRVYNTTDRELDVSLAWLNAADRYAGPVATEPVTLAPVGPVWTPPWIIGDEAVSYAQWFVGNTDALGRIAYVLRIAPAGDFPGANVMIDIPNAGHNSLAVQVGAGDDFHGFWSAHHGQDTALAVSDGSATLSPFRVRVATNQNAGTSPAPADGALGYNYQQVVVIEPLS